MKKTVYINLNGFAFHIEEDAYERLKQYLNKIEKSLSDPDEAREIISDIEARIAELFRGSHPSAEEVITLNHVNEVIKTMGEPQDIIDEEDQDYHEPRENPGSEEMPYSKRLYRDPDSRVFGGVCSGLGAYFNIDPLVFRVVFLLAFILYGASLLPYVILWIVMPKAVTIKQKLEMKGPAGYEKWEQNLRNEYKDVSDRIKNSNTYQNVNKTFSESGDKLGYAFRKFIQIIGGGIGIVIMLVTIACIVGLVLAFTFGYTLFDFTNINSVYSSIPNYFVSGHELTFGTIAILLITTIPLLALFFLGFKLVFKFKMRGGVLALILILLWIGGWVMLAYTSAKVARFYSDKETTYSSSILENTRSEAIYFKANAGTIRPEYQEHLFDVNRLDVCVADEEIFVKGNPRIEIKHGPEFKVTIKKSARGENNFEARENCNMIEYFWLQKDSVIYIDPIFTLTEGAKIRDQKLQVVFTIPENYKIKVDDDLEWAVNSNFD